MKDQPKTRISLIDCFRYLKDALKDVGKNISADNEDINITSVDEIPGLETYTSEEDKKLIRKMDNMREKLKTATKSVNQQIENPASRRKNARYKVIQEEIDK